MLKLSDLAQRPDFQLGPLSISPSRRRVEGPAGAIHLEPLVMQVFLLLLDARGEVITRDELFGKVWGGAMVGDDSLNRTIAGVRRVATETAPGLFEIETIPRTGYRLTGEISGHLHEDLDGPRGRTRLSRRALVGGGVAATALLGAGGIWWVTRPRTNPRFDALMKRGQATLLSGAPYDAKTTELYEQAIHLEPDNAKAWGLLAYFTSEKVESAQPEELDRLIVKAEAAIRRSLAIDPEEPNALTAMYLLNGPMLDWMARDKQLRDILAIDPDNIPALGLLSGLLQAAGLTRESWRFHQRVLELAPFSRNHLVFRAMKLWILGRYSEADKVIDRVRGLWPQYEFGWYFRFLLFAFTDRPQAALAMLESTPATRADRAAFWRPALEALDSGASKAIEAARTACLEVARNQPWRANLATLVLSALGQKDDAFQVANGYLLWRGQVVSANKADVRVVNDINRRMPPWLFTPPCAIMRADPRFLDLCEELGLQAYWRARGVKPDYIAYGS